ncbi:ABC transporter substrate-binding protein [Conexibacter stalactiti]|uniref:ABC transporter substrate-binding protein n=1 Tax=Conexibacter stalactiti TaxID=1940611 RepID=A0ABU4HUT5_9ACTN|nr:ABC transporter substrate-binding protein [Conexibacter stalactiti]MDW5596594.1 ABC transporter substrate-binding protein [Conexibacter stalactiti]MEC5037236.1 ABC transporter substrate-binding protein [Conexibacter stalactiti]
METRRFSPRRTIALALLLSTAPFALAACGSDDDDTGSGSAGASTASAQSDSSGGGGDPIKVGSLFSVTGPPAVVGDKMRKGLELAVDELNEAGGVEGRRLEVVFYDPAGDTAKAVDQTRRLISRDDVDVVVGGGSQSGIALAMQPLLQRADKLFMATEGAREIVQPADERPTTFKSTFNDTIVLQRTADFWNARGVRAVGFLPDTSGFGESAKAELERLAPEAGIEVQSESFDPTATNLTPQLTNLRRANPQAYVAWTTTPAATTFLKNAQQLGLDRNLLGLGFGSADPAFYEQAGAAARGALLSAGKLPIYDRLPDGDPQKAIITRFADAYEAKYNEPANVFAAQAYDGVQLVAEAIRASGGELSGEALAEALEGLGSYQGVNGDFRYTAEDHSGLGVDAVAISEWDGRRFVPARDGLTE